MIPMPALRSWRPPVRNPMPRTMASICHWLLSTRRRRPAMMKARPAPTNAPSTAPKAPREAPISSSMISSVSDRWGAKPSLQSDRPEAFRVFAVCRGSQVHTRYRWVGTRIRRGEGGSGREVRWCRPTFGGLGWRDADRARALAVQSDPTPSCAPMPRTKSNSLSPRPPLGLGAMARKSARLFACAPDRNRTCDLWYRKPTLYPLSYGGVPIEVITARWARRAGASDPTRHNDDRPRETRSEDHARGRSSMRCAVSVSGSLSGSSFLFSLRRTEDTHPVTAVKASSESRFDVMLKVRSAPRFFSRLRGS